VDVVGVYEADEAIRTGIAERYQVVTRSDPEIILGEADAVIVEGFDFQNPDLVRLALPRVAAVLLEKPGAPTVMAMRELLSEAARFPVHIQVGYMLQYSPVVDELHRIIVSGVLGQVTLARFHAATPAGCGAEVWQSLAEDEGGMLWTDGCHLVRCAIDLLGAPLEVLGSVRKLPTVASVVADYFKTDLFAGLGRSAVFHIGQLVHEDVASAVLVYPDKNAVLDITAWEAQGWVEGWRIELFGTDATLEAGLNPAWYRLCVRREHPLYGRGVTGRRYAGAVGPAETSLVVDATYTGEIDAFVKAVRRGSTDQGDLEAAATTLEVLHSIYESSKGRSPAPVRQLPEPLS
jgi:predicted dehydrogenase